MTEQTPAAEPLAFDSILPNLRGGSSAPAVTCAACQQQLRDEYFEINGRPFCTGCQTIIASQATPAQGIAPWLRAGLFGVGAAIAGAAVYYAVIALANLEIGFVAILIGYMVGYAVRRGTGGKGGRRFQVLAVVLTYWAVGLAYTPLAFKAAADAPTNAQTATKETPQPAPQEEAAGGTGLVVVTSIVLAFTFALPVLVVAGSMPSGLISAFIILIGMRQAWTLTAPLRLEVSGPFAIGPRDPVAAA